MEKSADQNKSKKSESSKDEKLISKESEKKESLSKHMTPLHEFKEELDKHKDVEEKLKKSLEFMRNALSQKGTPRFRDFWEAKKMCLPFFKEKINPAVKAKFWTQYTELSTEAKHLKEILDEQSSFSVEQIELALTAIQDDLTNHEEHIKKLEPISFPKGLFFVKDKLNEYEKLQRQISFYVTLSARTKDLRKEIIQTEMRVRSKNKLLEKLSKLADGFLPKKKDLIKEISSEFSSDVKKFASKYFDLEKKHILDKKLPHFKLREEIKAFQSFAKFLSLNSHAFSESRLTLSNCWSILKEEEKKAKSDFAQKRKDASEKIDTFMQKIKAVEELYKEEKPKSKDIVSEKIRELLKELKEAQFYKTDFLRLKKEIQSLEDNLLEPFYEVERQSQEKAHQAKKQEEEKVQTFKEKYLSLVSEGDKNSLHDLKQAFSELETAQKKMKLKFGDTLKFSEIHKELFELILLKQESEIEISDSESLQNLLSEWENFREQTRTHLEGYRKEMGNSGFDFEKAMLYRDQIDIVKDRLDRIVVKVEEIEEKLD